MTASVEIPGWRRQSPVRKTEEYIVVQRWDDSGEHREIYVKEDA